MAVSAGGTAGPGLDDGVAGGHRRDAVLLALSCRDMYADLGLLGGRRFRDVPGNGLCLPMNELTAV